jgi:hypothetical protein
VGKALLIRLNAFGMIAVAAIVVVGATAAVARGARTTRRIHARLADALGVKEGTRVTYHGVNVGVVQRLRLTPAGMVIDADLERADVPLRAGDSARVEAGKRVEMGDVKLSVSSVVELVPGAVSAPPLTDRDTLAAAAPRDQKIQYVIDPGRLRDSLARLVQRLRDDSIALARRTQRTVPLAASPRPHSSAP